MNIETVEGTLAETYRLLRPESILHADELMKERRTNEALRNQLVYTADGIVYSLQGKKKTPTLAMTRARFNPLFQDSAIDKYCQQLRENQNYRPTPDETSRALQAEDTVVIDLTALRLQGSEVEWRYFTVDTQDYKQLNNEEQKLVQRVYGKDDDFAQIMTMLADVGIRKTRVWVLNPDYLRTHAQESALGRASLLSHFDGGSNFLADTRGVNNHICVRGVRREVQP